MSFDALAWAAKQNPGSSGTKLVLLGLAECADRSHGLAFPSIAALVEFSCLDRKSVIANLTKLEAGGFISDTGRKVGQTGQIKVYRLNLETVPKTEQSQKRNGPKNPANSPKNGTRNKSEPDGGSNDPPTWRNLGKHLLPKDWSLPPVADLPPRARACAELWTTDSYETHGEAFICYWHARRGMYSDWVGVWANRIVALHSQVMRDQKFGNAPARASESAGKFNDPEARKAFLERLGPDPAATLRRANAEEDARKWATGPPRAIGTLAAGVLNQASSGRD